MLRLLPLVLCVSGNVLPKRVLPVRVEDRRFVDSSGRERHFRGVNVVYKDAPWLPTSQKFQSNLSFVQDDAELLRSLGVNLIRLGVMWPGVVPNRRAEHDLHYLKQVRDIIRMAAEFGIYTIVEPHQDEFNPKFCGEGVPDWYASAAAVTNFPEPVQSAPFSKSPPTRAMCDLNTSFDYIWTYDAARAYQDFWESGAEDFADYWVTVAAFFATEDAVIGGELFNEPFPGNVFGNQSFRDNKFADRVNLQPFYKAVADHVRNKVPGSAGKIGGFALAFEPTWPVGNQDIAPDSLLPASSGFTKLPEEDSIYAFHYYTPPCTTNVSSYLDERLKDAKRLKAAPFASELNLWAYDDTSEQKMAETLQAFESRLISLTGWQYKSYSGSLPEGTCTGCGNSFFENSGALNEYMARAMGRPFACAVAGRTTAMTWDGRTFSLKYVPLKLSGPTELFVPEEVQGVGALQIQVLGDAAARVQQTKFAGRRIADGVSIRSWHEAQIWLSEDASTSGRQIEIQVRAVEMYM